MPIVNPERSIRQFNKPKWPGFSRLLNLSGWVLSIALIAWFGRSLYAQSDDWVSILAGLDWRLVLLSTGLLAVGQALFSQTGYIVHQFFGYPLSRWLSYRFWFVAQLAKYMPGGVWMVATGVTAYTRNGMPLVLASAATTWGIIAVLISSLMFSLLGIGTFVDSAWTVFIGITAGVLIVCLLLLLLEWPWLLLLRLSIKRAQPMLDVLQQLGRRRYALLAYLLILCLGGWLLIGSGFYVLLLAFNLPQNLSLAQALAYYALAWTGGFLVIIAPTGLGPREALLTALLAPVLGTTTAISVALFARLWWSVGDVLHISTAFLVPVLRRESPVEKDNPSHA